MAASILLALSAIYVCIYYSPSARSGRTLLHHLSDEEIISIELTPVQNGYPQLIDTPKVVEDRMDVTALAQAFSSMRALWPNHPDVVWSVDLRIQLKKDRLVGRLVGLRNGGAIFYYMSNVEEGWILGTYSISPDKRIREILSSAVHTDTAP